MLLPNGVLGRLGRVKVGVIRPDKHRAAVGAHHRAGVHIVPGGKLPLERAGAGVDM